MPFIPFPSGVRVAVEFTKNGQLVVNVFHCTTPEPFLTANLTAIGQAFLQWWENDMKSTQCTAIALQRIVVTDVSTPNSTQIAINGNNSTGTIVGTDTPNNVAIVVSHLTGFAGRTRRGRSYVAGLLASDVANDVVPVARANAYVTAFNGLRTRVAAANAALVVASYQVNNAPRVQAVGSVITTFRCDTRVDTQRRRLLNTGA